ncbi:MAG: hypothetical protein NXH82_07270 [Rhodobacteraceae bacterium]|nr:hypothetical protein [Paracoccaceae bacterium]
MIILAAMGALAVLDFMVFGGRNKTSTPDAVAVPVRNAGKYDDRY